MFKKIPKSRKTKIKTIKIITEDLEHVCSDECLRPRKKLKPRGLKKFDLGLIHRDKDGRFYHPWGENDWLEVTGMTFLNGPKGLHLMFHPKDQLHIHSLGGKTLTQSTKKSNFSPGHEYHAEEAAKSLKRKGYNLKTSLNEVDSKVRKHIPKSPRKKQPIKGTGRGGPGIPRTSLAEEIVRLIDNGLSKKVVLQQTITWAIENSLQVAGPYKNNIKKQLDRWWDKKSGHK